MVRASAIQCLRAVSEATSATKPKSKKSSRGKKSSAAAKDAAVYPEQAAFIESGVFSEAAALDSSEVQKILGAVLSDATEFESSADHLASYVL